MKRPRRHRKRRPLMSRFPEFEMTIAMVRDPFALYVLGQLDSAHTTAFTSGFRAGFKAAVDRRKGKR